MGALIAGTSHTFWDVTCVQLEYSKSCDATTDAEFDFYFIWAGAKFRGEFEERLKAVLKEVQDANGQIVLFIDEIHTVVGAGAAEGRPFGWILCEVRLDKRVL